MRKLVVMLIAGVVLLSGSASRALAIVTFGKEFQNLYITPDTDKEFTEVVKHKKDGCLVCHQGKKRKNHNAYGVHLVELLDKKKDKKDSEKIVASLKKVAEMRSDPEDEKSPTFGELIAAGKLPGGALEDLMKEPETEEEESK
jgi:hypothetical protein